MTNALRVRRHLAALTVALVGILAINPITDVAALPEDCSPFDRTMSVPAPEGITVGLEIPGTTFSFGEQIPMTLRIRNNRSSTFVYETTARWYDFYVIDTSGATVWDFDQTLPSGNLQMLEHFSIPSGGELSVTETWHQGGCAMGSRWYSECMARICEHSSDPPTTLPGNYEVRAWLDGWSGINPVPIVIAPGV